MKRIQTYIFIIFNTFCLLGCIGNERGGLQIPSLPSFDEKARKEAALKMLSAAISSSPSNPENFYKRANIYLASENFADGSTDIDQAIELDANQNRYHLLKALLLRGQKKPEKALEAAKRAEILKNTSPELLTLLGDLYQQIGQYGKASLYLAKSTQASPNNGETYYYSALVTAKTDDSLTAIPLLEKALSLKPSFLPTYLTFSSLYTNSRQYPLALYYSELGLKYHPKSGELYLKRGITYQRIFKLDSAIFCYNRAIAFEPALYQASFNSGILFFKIRNYASALGQFLHTKKYKPDFPELNNLIGQCYEYTGNLEKAEEFYTIASTANPEDYRALNGLFSVKRKLMYGDSAMASYKNPYPDVQFKDEYIPDPRLKDTTTLKSIEIKVKPRIRMDTASKRLLNPLNN